MSSWRRCSTYIAWDNTFRLLIDFDIDKLWYFGSPSLGTRGFWMANGGPAYVLSCEVVKRLVRDDFNSNGTLIGSTFTQRWEDRMTHDYCDDPVLSLALYEYAQTNLSGLFPVFQPHLLHEGKPCCNFLAFPNRIETFATLQHVFTTQKVQHESEY
jgi:hypothetical protein